MPVTPKSTLLVYLCDGSLGWAHGRPWVELCLCGFTANSISTYGSILKDKAKIDRFSIKHAEKYPRLYIGSRARALAFFAYIMRGGRIPKGYEYKFRGFIGDDFSKLRQSLVNAIP